MVAAANRAALNGKGIATQIVIQCPFPAITFETHQSYVMTCAGDRVPWQAG